jgi:hypothetical protein
MNPPLFSYFAYPYAGNKESALKKGSEFKNNNISY